MNIYFSPFCTHSTSFFKETTLALTAQQQKILALASLIFGTLAVFIIVKRCCFKASIQEKEQDILFKSFVSNQKEDEFIGDKKEDEFIADTLNGQGKMTLDSGEVHEGEFKNGVLNGKGKKTFANGDIYEGEFKEGLLHGQGKLARYPTGTYEGEFKEGVFHGKGKLTTFPVEGHDWMQHCILEGQFTDGVLNGKGTLISLPDNNDILEVEFKDGMPSTIFKKTSGFDGTIYEGEFNGAQLSGQGKKTYADGTVDEGEFKKNYLNGKGIRTFAEGLVQKGTFKKGKFLTSLAEK